MSKISLTGNTSGSGTVFIQAPNTNTDRNVVISEAVGNVAISDGSTLTVDYASNRTTFGGKADFSNASTVKLDKWNIIGANTTLSVGQNYFANTRAQANLQLTLPASANLGDTIMVQDQEGFASSNNVVVLRNGHNIDGVERNAVLTVDNSGVTLVYESARNGWVTVKHTPKDLVGFQGTVSGYASGGSIPPAPAPALSDTIDKFPFASDSNATDVGNLTVARNESTGQSSSVSGYNSGGADPSITNVIDKFPFATDTNATDVGDLSTAIFIGAGQSSSTSGYASGGNNPPVNIIQKFPFAVDTNATDIGDLTQARRDHSGQSSSSFGYNSGGFSPPWVNTIDKFPFSVDTNASDVGDLARVSDGITGQSSSVSGYGSGGYIPGSGRINNIDKFPFATDTNATDVGDLTQGKTATAGQSSTNDGYASGGTPDGPTNIDTIEKFPFASDANASDVANLTQARRTAEGQQV